MRRVLTALAVSVLPCVAAAQTSPVSEAFRKNAQEVSKNLIAAAPTLQELESRLAAVGHDPEQVVYEQVPEAGEDACVGGAEFLSCGRFRTSQSR